MKTMKVDIWSDVRCPFCYIGKHKFEKALEQFSNNKQIEVIWHSFELDPNLQTDATLSTPDHLANSKGISRSQADQMMQYASHAAKEIGLTLNFNKAIVANSFNAHRLIQVAKEKKLGSELEEALFRAHFTDGKNIDDQDVLMQTGIAVGLNESEIKEALHSDDYAYKVRQDEAEAQSLGIRGVPYFVFNDKYAVSGAQPTETFLDALSQSWNEFEREGKPEVINDGSCCLADGQCN